MQNKILYCFFIIFYSCQFNNAEIESTIEVEISEEASNSWEVYGSNGKYGYKDKNGNVVHVAQFHQAFSFHRGSAIVELDSGMCLINYNGEVITDFYDQIDTNEYFSSSIYLAKINYSNTKATNQNTLTDNLNELRELSLPPSVEEEEANEDSDKFDLPEYLLDSMCLIDYKGNRITDYYNNIEATERGHYISRAHKEDFFALDKKYLLDSFGKTICGPYEDIDLKGPCYIVENNLGSYFMNDTGKIISTNYYWIDYLEEPRTYRCTKIAGKNYCIVDSTGKEMIPPKFSEIFWWTNHQFYLVSQKVGSKEYQGIYTKDYAVLKKPEQYIVCNDENNYLAISNGLKYAFYVFTENTFVKKSEDFDIIIDEYAGTRKLLFLTQSYSGTNYILPIFKDGLARVYKNRKYGFINDKLEIVIPIEYDYCDEKFSNNECYVEKNGEKFFINKSGKRAK